MKVGLATVLSNDIAEVEEEIYDCIRVAHPDFLRASLPEFIDSVDEVVENSAEEGEQHILDTYEPAPVHESDSDAGDIQDVAVISCKAALEALELLRLFRLQNPRINLQRSEQMEGPLYREKRDIEGLSGMARRTQH